MRRTMLTLLAVLVLPATADAAAPGTLSFGGCASQNGTAPCSASAFPQSLMRSPVLSPDQRRVYVPFLGSDVIGIFDRSGPSGTTLTPAGCVKLTTSPASCASSAPGLDGVSDAVVSADGRNLYAVSNVSDALTMFRIESDGSLTSLGCIGDTASPAGCATTVPGLDSTQFLAISPDGSTVVTTQNATPSAVRSFQRQPDGTLTPVSCVRAAALAGCTTVAALADQVFRVRFNPAGTRVAMVGGTPDQVAVLDVTAHGALAFRSCLTEDGAGACDPAGDAFDDLFDLRYTPDGRSLIVTARDIDVLMRLSADPTTGALSFAECLEPTGGTLCGSGTEQEVPGLGRPSGLAVAPDGRELVVSTGTGGAVASLVRIPITPTRELGRPALQCADAPATANCPGTDEIAAIEDVGPGPVISADGATFLAESNNRLIALRREVAPVCADSLTPVSGPTTVALPCSDANGEPVSRVIVGPPYHGTVGPIDQAAGSAVFTPTPGYVGPDGFTFSANDPSGNISVLRTASMTIAPPPAPTPTPTATPGPVATPTPSAAPVLTRLRASTTRFRPTSAGGLTTTSAKRTATTLSFTLSRAVPVRVTLAALRGGRRSGSRCVAPTARNRRARACTRTVTLKGSATVAGKAGSANRIRLTGRRSGKPLGAGRYRFTLRPAGGRPASITLTVLARRR